MNRVLKTLMWCTKLGKNCQAHVSWTLHAVFTSMFVVLPLFRRFGKNCLKRLSASSCLSVCLSVVLFDIWEFFENLPRKLKFHYNVTRIMGSLQENMWKFDYISLNSSYNEKCFGKSCGEYQNSHFMFNNFLPENRALYEIMWKSMTDADRPLMRTQHGAEKNAICLPDN